GDSPQKVGDYPLNLFIALTTIGATAPSFPTAEGNGDTVNFPDQFFRFAAANDNAFNHLSVNLNDPGRITERLRELSAMDQVDGDLTAYAQHGGKLIMLHGTADMLVSPRLTEKYYERLIATMGAEQVRKFL